MAEFTWIADYDAGEDSTPRTLSAKFGDGYEQRAPDGINSLLRTWTWAFNNRSMVETGEITDFLKLKNGVTEFTHDLPGVTPTETVTVVCRGWSKRWAGFESFNVTAKFEEVISISV
jgi:phage-related protein